MLVYVSEDVFSYEIQALVKAFFPMEPIILKIGRPEPAKEYIDIYITNKIIKVTFVRDGKTVSRTEKEKDTVSRRKFKDSVKLALYEAMEQGEGRKLLWGTLTGVRPTKLVMELAEEGLGRNEIIREMRKRYYCSVEKAELGYEVVTREKALLEKMDYKNGYSVYIGIPFCPTTCLYCSFTSFSMKKFSPYVEDYLKALFQEIEYGSKCFTGKKLETIYIGGGTPTALTAVQLEQLLAKIRECFDFSYVKEFTVEAGRPDSITREKLEVLARYQVSRISINPQTMKQETLDLIGRHHSVGEVVETFAMARNEGFANINMDLIAGLPGETAEDVQNTLERIGELDPDSITMHSLVLKRASMLNIKKDQYGELAFGDADEMISMAYLYGKQHGMMPYYLYRQKNTTGSRNSSRENAGYAKPGKEGLYNILIMEEKHTIIALGAGGCSKFVFPDSGKIQRIENVKNLKEYVDRVGEMILRKKNFIEGDYYEFI